MGAAPRRGREGCGTAARRRSGAGGSRLLILPNVPAYPVLFYGTLLAGGIVVPMNPLLKSGEISYYYQDAGTKFSFVWPDFAEEASKAAQIAAIEGVGTQVIECTPMGPVAGRCRTASR